MKKIIRWIVIIVCILLCGGLGWYFLSHQNAIDVTEGATVVYSGVNGYGSIHFAEELPLADNENYQKLLADTSVDGTSLIDTLSCTWQNEDGSEFVQGTLSNGDTVVYACTYDTDLAKEMGYSFAGLHTKYSPTNLPDGNVVDFFDGLTVEWRFTNNELIVVADDTNLNEIALQFAPQYEIEVNDSVAHVRVSSIDSEELLTYGYTPIAMEKEYEVGTQPVRTTDYYNADVIEAAHAATQIVIDQDVANCGSLISNGNSYPILGYEFQSLGYGEEGQSLTAYYLVSIAGRTLYRSYAVDVFQYADGSYRGFTDEGNSATSCQVPAAYNYWTK